MSHM